MVSTESLASRRRHMVNRHLRRRGILDPRVLDAMSAVPREAFIARELASQAYADRPLPIGEGQTISQPFIEGLMTQLLDVSPGDLVRSTSCRPAAWCQTFHSESRRGSGWPGSP